MEKTKEEVKAGKLHKLKRKLCNKDVTAQKVHLIDAILMQFIKDVENERCIIYTYQKTNIMVNPRSSDKESRVSVFVSSDFGNIRIRSTRGLI